MKILTKLAALFRRKKIEDDLAEELRLHLEHRIEENIAAGMSPEEARYAASRRFGGVQQVKERCRDESRWVGLEQWVRDVRFGARSLGKTPAFTLVAVITLALGIGLNASMFSLADAVLLRRLPFADTGQLVRLYRTTPRNDRGGFSRADYLDIKREESRFGRIAAYYFSSISLSEPGRPAEWQNTLRVSADFFDVLGVQPLLGRTFRPEEEANGNHRVLVISHAFWHDRFGGAGDVVGRTLRCNGEPYEIIGVLPPAAHDQRIFGNARLFRPLGFTEAEKARRDIAFMDMVGRRDEKLSVAEGAAVIGAYGAQLAAAYPAVNAKSGWRSVGLQASTRKPPVPTLVIMLLGLSGAVLLIACSNLANFLLARAIARTRESAVRVALGASRAQLLRPLVVECLLLATVGGAGALVVMTWTARWFNQALIKSGDSPVAFALNWTVLGFSAAVSVATILFFGLATAIFTHRINTNQALKSGGQQGTASRGLRRFRHGLIVAQFALATVLVAAAGFFTQGTENLMNQQRGWSAEHVVQGYFQLPFTYVKAKRVGEFQRQATEQLSHLPGVRAASLSYALPYLGMAGGRRYVAEGPAPEAEGQAVQKNGVSPAYFETTGTRLLRGRAFNEADTATSPRVVVLSESLARALFPAGDALGRRVAQTEEKSLEWKEVVGVVADVRAVDFSDAAGPFQLYEPMAQDDWYNGDGKLAEMFLAVRTDGVAPESLLSAIRAAIMAIDADLPIRDLMPATGLIERRIGSLGLIRNLLAGFAVLGLLLAVLGIYGVIARTVAQRTMEIGIRMALGAQMTDVTRLVLRSGLRLAVGGALLGVLGGWGLARVVRATFPAMPTDAGLVLMVTTGCLVLVALAACYLPARRAAKIDPLVALRSE
jgi:putative ABC transport system permease protein